MQGHVASVTFHGLVQLMYHHIVLPTACIHCRSTPFGWWTDLTRSILIHGGTELEAVGATDNLHTPHCTLSAYARFTVFP